MSDLEDELPTANRISVRERDLDNFLVEELRASREFRGWFLDRLNHCIDLPGYAIAKVGKNPDRESTPGQTDLSCSLRDETGTELVHILIEDKVALGFQPSQPERYAEEVSAARQRLGDRRAAAVLIAPSSNKAVLDNPHFDLSVRLEEIITYLEERRGTLSQADNRLAEELRERLSARIELLDALCRKRSYNGNWTPNPVPERVSFFEQYRALASRLVPHFKTTQSSGGQESTSMLFTVPRIPELPVRNIRHEFKTGVISIVFNNAARTKTMLDRSGLLPPRAVTEATRAGSLLVRVSTHSLDPTGERFSEQKSLVEAAITAAVRLYDWAMENANRLSAIINVS